MTATCAKATLPQSGRPLYLVLFALAWFQLSYASHQFEHVAGDLTDPCVVCTQIERFDDTAVPANADFAVLAPVGIAIADTGSPFQPVAVRRYETRAPPVV